jgi:hypothetical protein
MICTRGHLMIDTALVCSICMAEQDRQAMRELQLEFLRKAVNGDWNYALRVAKMPERHVIMFSSQVRTFCGLELKTKPRIGYEAYTDATLEKLCAGCRMAVKDAVAEAMAT